MLVLEGAKAESRSELSLEEAVALARALVDGGEKPTEAAKQSATASGLRKNEIYRELLK